MIEHSQKIAALIYKHLQGELSAQEKAELDEWIAESEENAASFKQLTDKGIYDQVKKDFDDARLVAAAERLSRRVGFEVKPYVQGGSKATLRRMGWKKYVAAAAVILLAAVGMWLYKTRQPAVGTALIAREQPGEIRDIRPWGDKSDRTINNGSNTVTIPRGGKHLVILPDGSRVWLNADSKIIYPQAFAAYERKVYLSGEAYFEVTKNENAPFRISLPDDAMITVRGTHFNVRSYKGEHLTTSLLEGKITLTRGNDSITLKPLEQAVIGSNKDIKRGPVTDSLGIISWKDGTLTFSRADIHTFINAVSRTYNIDIRCEPDADFRTFNYTGNFPMNLTIGDLLRELSKRGCDLNAQLTGSAILIKPK